MRAGPPRYAAGVAASLIAETLFMGVVAVVSSVRGMDPWRVIRMPGSFLLGPSAVTPPGFVPNDVLLGLLMHLWLGILVGVIYAALLPWIGVAPLAGGLLTGGMLYVIGFWALPLLFPAWLAPFWLPPAVRALQAGAHLAYGVAFGLSYRRLAR